MSHPWRYRGGCAAIQKIACAVAKKKFWKDSIDWLIYVDLNLLVITVFNYALLQYILCLLCGMGTMLDKHVLSGYPAGHDELYLYVMMEPSNAGFLATAQCGCFCVKRQDVELVSVVKSNNLTSTSRVSHLHLTF